MKKMNKKGFTLIEMLVVIAIIAILVAIVIPTVSNATTKAKEATDVANIRSYVAEYQVATVSGDSAAKTAAANKLTNFGTAEKKSSDATYTYDAATGVVTYDATVLNEGNGSTTDKTIYKWTVGDVYSEGSTTGGTTGGTTDGN